MLILRVSKNEASLEKIYYLIYNKLDAHFEFSKKIEINEPTCKWFFCVAQLLFRWRSGSYIKSRTEDNRQYKISIVGDFVEVSVE